MRAGAGYSTWKIFIESVRILSSRVFLIWLISLWSIFYVMAAIWTNETFARFVNSLEGNPLVQAPFVLFLTSGYLNLARASRDGIRSGEKRLLPRLLLPLGAMVFLTGFFVSITTRQFDWLLAGPDHIVKPFWSARSYRVVNVNPGVKERFLDIDIDAGGGIFSYEPRLILTDDYSNTFEVGAFPPVNINGTYFHILQFGLAPGISLIEGSKRREEGYIPLRILTPGSSDYFEFPSLPFRFLISMRPERVFQKGSVTASEYNLREPIYNMRVFQGDRVIAEGTSKEGLSFNSLSVRFLEPTFWIQIEVVRDPGVPIVLAGLGLVAAGILVNIAMLLARYKDL